MIFVLNQAKYLFKRNRTANLLGYKQVKGAALVQCRSLLVLLLPPYPPTPDSEPCGSLPGVTSLLIPEQSLSQPPGRLCSSPLFNVWHSVWHTGGPR